MIQGKNPAVAGVEGLASEPVNPTKSTSCVEGAGSYAPIDGKGESEAAPAPVPPDMSRDRVQMILDGKHSKLVSAFIWAQTPQGYNFWQREYDSGLTDEGRAILQAWVDATRPAQESGQ